MNTLERTGLPTAWIARLPRWFRYEDAVLFGFSIFVQPLLARAGRSGFENLDDASPPVGLWYIAALIGAVTCLATRPEGLTFRFREDGMSPFEYARFPFIASAALIGGAGFEALGLADGGILVAPLFVVVLVSWIAAPRLPTLKNETRRALMTPMIIAGASAFGGTMAGVDLFGLGLGLVDTFGFSLDSVAFAILITVTVPGMFYVLFVFVPRQLADPEGTWGQWIARYWLFLGSSLIASWWVRLLGAQ